MNDGHPIDPPEPTPAGETPADGAGHDRTPVQADAAPQQAESQQQEVAPLFPDDLAREVSEAMDSMDLSDLGELTGDLEGSETPEPGTELIGTVVGVSDDDVFLQFGVKMQGVMPRSQFGKKESIEVGRQVDVVVERLDDSAGLLIVSRQGAIVRATWTNLTVGMLVEGRVSGVIKGGLEVNLKGIRAFMPISQVALSPMKDTSLLLNEMVQCEVVELDRRAKNVVVSRRKILERHRAEAKEKLQADLEVGQVRKGIVRRIVEFGAFVDLGGLDGLVHIREMSWGTVNKVTDILSVDQEVEVTVLNIDLERGRISLGLRQSLPDPWVDVSDKYPVGTTLKARVVRLANFGVFAELESGVEGLIPISEMGWARIRQPSDIASVGDMVDCVVIRLEPERRRLALSMKQVQPDPWDGVMDGFSEDTPAKGIITKLMDFGAFVEVAPGVEGLIHISELSERRVNACSDVVQVGQEIEARVLKVDVENRRISLSLKPAAKLPEASSIAPDQNAKKPKKRKKPLRGGLSSHFNW